MRKVSIRLPDDVVAAYDAAAGVRSSIMRRLLVDAVADGRVRDVPDDLLALAEREAAVDRGRLARKRGTFRRRCYDFFRDKWVSGAVTPDDADDLAESWRREGALYGEEYLAFVEAILSHYSEAWEPAGAPDFPTPGAFIERATPGSVDVSRRLVETAREGRERGLSREAVRDRLSTFHPEARVEAALSVVWDGDADREVTAE